MATKWILRFLLCVVHIHLMILAGESFPGQQRS